MIHAPQSSPAPTRLPACCIVICAVLAGAFPTRSAAQQRTLAATTLHRAPAGAALARLAEPTTLTVRREQRGWAEVMLDGWVATNLVTAQRRDGFDLAIKGSDVILRETPGGEEIARLEKGMLLDRVAARGAWTHVRRAVWVPARALSAPPAAAANRAPSRPAAYRPMDTTATPAAPLQAPAAQEPERVEVARPAPMFSAPGAAQIGTMQPGTPARVLSRNGEWLRVQTEVWIRESDVKVAADASLLGVSAAEVRANPERYVGQVVDWRVQFVSTAVADELRPEMPPGQPYVLVRGPLPEPGFVYMMVRAEELARIRALPALTEMTVRVAIRAARTRFLATPVVELRTLLDPATGAQ